MTTLPRNFYTSNTTLHFYDPEYRIYICPRTTSEGKPVSLGFIGKRAKPVFHYSFLNAEQQEQFEQKFIEDQWEAAERAAQYKAERRVRRARPHSLKVGDILYSCWGYEQTNVDFYQVVGTRGKCTVLLRKIAAWSVKETGWASDLVVAVKDAFLTDEILIKRASHENRVNISSCSSASPYDGRPIHRSWYA